MKKLMALLLATLLIFSSLTVVSFAQDEVMTASCENGHTWGPWETDIDGYCGTKDYYRRECTAVGCTATEQKEITDMITNVHTMFVKEGKAPTCTRPGMTDYEYCSTCHLENLSKEIPKLGHIDEEKDKNGKVVGNGNCDRCEALLDSRGACKCMCHDEGGIIAFIWKIVIFVQELFDTNKTCDCGVKHY